MRAFRFITLALTIAMVTGCALRLSSTDQAPAGWTLVWSDEFDGAQVDGAKWDFDLGNGFFQYDQNAWIPGWGNRELQYYTRESQNVFVKDGMLHLRALREGRDGAGYTSGRLTTRKRDGSELFSKTYGRFEFRAKLPTGQGVWPALWMLPRDDKYGGWASSGEIDVTEARGQSPTRVDGTLHYGARWQANTSSGNSYVFPAGESIADFHLYALEWEPGEIRWLVDDKLYARQAFWWSSSRVNGVKGIAPERESDLNPWPAPFDQPFYLIINLAIGGDYLGNPDKTTPFPAEMLVDYVRVYDKVGGYASPKPRSAGKLPFGPP